MEAQVLWLNQRAMQDDPLFTSANCDQHRYQENLLDRCAYEIDSALLGAHPDPSGWTGAVIGWADRYGGEGIGCNGGSGRAVVLHGYHLKGVGRTPLIARDCDFAHASGGAYLEESVREAIFAEIVAAEFPYGGEAILAIIDTGQVQRWPSVPPKCERRVVVVRRSFFRPAHLQRAVHFLSDLPHAGGVDAQRVRAMWDHFQLMVGANACGTAIQEFWERWAAQLAFSFAHRLSHGGTTTSNVCFDAKLVDFGGAAALPSWARITLGTGGAPFGFELQTMAEAFMDFLYYLSQHLPRHLFPATFIDDCLLRATDVYKQTYVDEFLRLCGLGKEAVAARINTPAAQDVVFNAVNAALAPSRAEAFDIFLGTPIPKRPVDLSQVWDDPPPPHLALLRAALPTINGTREQTACRARSKFLTRPRSNLYREELKKRLFEQLECSAVPVDIDRIISNEIAQGRRSAVGELSAHSPAGFAVSASFSLALFRCDTSGCLVAVVEWCTPDVIPQLSAGTDIVAGACFECTLTPSQDGVRIHEQTTLTCSISLSPAPAPCVQEPSTDWNMAA